MLTWWKIKLNFRAFVRWPSTPANKALPRAADLICRFLMLLPNNHHQQAPGDAYSLSNRATLYYGWQIFIENIDSDDDYIKWGKVGGKKLLST